MEIRRNKKGRKHLVNENVNGKVTKREGSEDGCLERLSESAYTSEPPWRR